MSIFDAVGNLQITTGIATLVLTPWTTANWTGGFTATLAQGTGCQSVLVQLDQNSSITAGAVTWQGTYDGINWVTIPPQQVLDPTSAIFVQIPNPYTFVASANKSFLILMGGYQQIRALETTPMTGAGASISPYVLQLAYSPVSYHLVSGVKTNNAVIPDGTNLGVLTALANAANPAWTEGNQVLLSTDLSGHLRSNVNKWGGTILGTPTNFGTTPGAVVAGSVNSSVFIGTTAAVAASAGVQKVGITGNTGATVDAAIGGAASTNALWTMESASTASAAACTATFINNTGASVSIKASAGNLYGFSITNETAAVAYIEFFNIATTPVLGTTAVVFAIKLPASSNITIPAGNIGLMNFATGIGFAVVTTENGSTTAAVTGMIFFK